MTALKIAAAILLVLLLLGRLRLGGGGEYSADGVRAWAQVGAFSIPVYPRKKKEKPPKPEKKKKEKNKGTGHKEPEAKAPTAAPETEEKPPASAGGPIDKLRRYLPLVGEAAGALKRRIRIDELLLDVTLGGAGDAAASAMAFGYSNAAAGMILAVFEQNFDVKRRRVRTAVDFNAESPRVYIRAGVSVRLGQALSFVLRFGWKFLKLRQEEKKSVNSKKEAI